MTTGADRKEWVAGRPFRRGGKGNRTGGKLVLEGDTLTFRPLFGLGITKRYPIADIDRVESIDSIPPKLRITTRDGRDDVFMVAPKVHTPVWSKDTSARDDAVATISALLS